MSQFISTKNLACAVNASPLKQYAALAMAAVLSGWVYIAYTLIDGIFIGRYVGQQALAALNLVTPLTYIPYAISVMVGVGGSTLIARLLGEQRVTQAQRAFTQVLWAMLALGVIVSGMVLIFKQEITLLLGATGALADDVNAYLGIWGWFVLFSNGLYALELFLRAEGPRAARFGVFAMLLGALTNIALDYLLIVLKGMGLQGAALATGLSMMVSSCAMFAYHMTQAKRIVPVRRAFADCGERYIIRVACNGASEFLSALAPVITVFVFNRVVLSNFGETGLAAYAVLEYIVLGATVTMIALVESMQPIVSYYRGARNVADLYRAFRVSVIATVVFSVVVAIGTTMASRPLTFLFLPAGDEAWTILQPAVPWYALAFLPAAINLIVTGFLTACEAPGPSATIAVLRSWILLLGTVWVLDRCFGSAAIWYGVLVTELLTLVASAWLYWRTTRNGVVT
ncbi:MATE family efflux transporter [Burkholderia sp. BCC0322]|uniref:MATE family efflux transporter n=1 Tax=unclassified Burkholderia TaxID=2613784 RepID=UPI00158DC297|nr:MATE family efflux transporter [Burkholderia sp. BCC0322]